MKKLLFLCSLLITINAYAQDEAVKLFPTKDGKVVYEEVVELSGAKKDDLYKAAKKWVVDTYVSAKGAIQSEDKEGGQLLGKGRMPVTKKGALGIKELYNVDFYWQVDCKEGKYRYRIYDIKHTLDGKTESDLFSKYQVNVPAETSNDMASGKTGTKSQAKDAAKIIVAIDEAINKDFTAFKAAMKKGAVADNF